MDTNEQKLEKATLGAGCFWCVEAVFQRLQGVESVVSGYMGGDTENPTYQEICTGLTNHAEVAQLTYDPKQISFPELLQVFWQTHDPTTLNQQGNDVGTQYRSVIFYHNEQQKQQAETLKNELDQAAIFSKPIVTEISPASIFYPAETEHQDFYNQHQQAPYCTFIIDPKIDKLKKFFKDKLKKSA